MNTSLKGLTPIAKKRQGLGTQLTRGHLTIRNHQSMSFYSHSDSPVDFYPFKYDEDMELNELAAFQSGPEAPPSIGSKIDEVFDFFFEDSLFRLFCPQPLKYSPLAMKFTYGNGKKQNYFLPKGFVSYSLFGSPTSASLLQWQKALYQESLLDAGIYTPADLIVDSSLSHRSNRRSVYELADQFKDMAAIRAGRMRVVWRYCCHFTIYFIKGIFAGFGMYTTDRFLIPYFKFIK